MMNFALHEQIMNEEYYEAIRRDMEEEEENKMFVDYNVAKECRHNCEWYLCIKCGKCGRKFENGFMVDDGGTTMKEDEENE